MAVDFIFVFFMPAVMALPLPFQTALFALGALS